VDFGGNVIKIIKKEFDTDIGIRKGSSGKNKRRTVNPVTEPEISSNK
jgi:hypothetical protein